METMERPSLEELLERLEDARDAGQPLSPEDLCQQWPELLIPLKERWQRLLRFEQQFGVDNSANLANSDSEPTRRESTGEIQKKLSMMSESRQGERFVLQSEIHLDQFHDRGGLGDVYRGHESELEREVAIKLLRADRQGQAHRDDFRRESHIIGRMNHPGIVSILGAGETIDGRPFYTMPFLDGGNLRSRTTAYHVEHPTRLDADAKEFRDLIYRLASVCKTVAYAHSRSIVHRDLKAENILLGKYGETLVIDWGCAVKVERDPRFNVFWERTIQLPGTASNSANGLTLRYASPEQLHGGQPIGPESDIYSLGAILYLILSGQSPLQNTPDDKIRKRVLDGDIPTVEGLKSGVPKSLAAVCRKAMAVRPAERYLHALEMAEDLERYLSDEPVSVLPDTASSRISRIVRRNRTASIALFGVLVIASSLLAIAFAGQSMFARQATASAQQRLSLAANLAASVGGFEINRRFALLEREAEQPNLVAAMQAIAAQPNDRSLWEKPQAILWEFRDELMRADIKHESVFLMDARGVQVARAMKSDSIGKNFAYRQYFHGQRQDLDPDSAEYQTAPPEPSSGPIISTAYVSTSEDQQTGEHPIKTAFAVAIMGEDADGRRRVLGRLGMSLKINDLSIFDPLEDLSLGAVLIETRNYQWGSGTARGLVLDQFNTQQSSRATAPISAVADDVPSEAAVKDAMPRLSNESLESFVRNPGGQAQLLPGFYDPQVSRYRRDAAYARLRIPYRNDLTTGWTVLFIESGQ
jgi:eukaryotic-like serine/threonine-protein kinase